ncbi:hypothetical protein TBK1r_17110 [Stieleria magnilauensis]|uniref:Uncharacterized protein n=1 Tax=Stieleria magnilauensis TaxID=2527963 RepID=A0ABX5XS95_9BACT|nr:hypothetical protein TBK1r_17110 [Planctomycetes bacterium TBK1r]
MIATPESIEKSSYRFYRLFPAQAHRDQSSNVESRRSDPRGRRVGYLDRN